MAKHNNVHSLTYIYNYYYIYQITCQVCSRVSEREEEFLDIPVALSGQVELDEALKESFIKLEQLNGSNQYFCGRCQKLVDANRVSEVTYYQWLIHAGTVAGSARLCVVFWLFSFCWLFLSKYSIFPRMPTAVTISFTWPSGANAKRGQIELEGKRNNLGLGSTSAITDHYHNHCYYSACLATVDYAGGRVNYA